MQTGGHEIHQQYPFVEMHVRDLDQGSNRKLATVARQEFGELGSIGSELPSALIRDAFGEIDLGVRQFVSKPGKTIRADAWLVVAVIENIDAHHAR